MEGSKNKQCMASWCCKYHLFGVTFIAFGISLVLFLPDFVNNLIMQVSRIKVFNKFRIEL